MTVEQRYRIGEVAELVGTTPRTIRYYEEFGLLAAPPSHEKGRHRTYDDADVRRLQELIRLRDLLGVSLDELKSLVEAEEARAAAAACRASRATMRRWRYLTLTLE